jgi:hypothetical protein
MVAKTSHVCETCLEKWRGGEDSWKERERICGGNSTKGVECKKGERESENSAARIPEENVCGWEILRQEADGSANRLQTTVAPK